VSGRRTWADGLASFAGIALALAACGARSSDDMQLLTSAEWKDDPGSTAEIGFWVSVDVGWNSRVDSCSPLSAAVHVTVDDHEAEYVPYSTGDCVWDALF
jgi:hypothetical protein